MVGYRRQRNRKSILLTWEVLRAGKAGNLINSFCTVDLTDSGMEIYKKVSKITLVKLKVALLLIRVFNSRSIHTVVFFSSGMSRATIF